MAFKRCILTLNSKYNTCLVKQFHFNRSYLIRNKIKSNFKVFSFYLLMKKKLISNHCFIYRIWLARKPSKNFAQKSSHKHQRPIHHSACRSPGRPMVKPCSLVTVTTQSVYGKCQSQHPAKMLIEAVLRISRILL